MMWDKKRDRMFQLEVLRVQLKHEKLVVFYSATISTGIAFIVMALPLGALLLSEGITGGVWWLMIWSYLIVGSILAFYSLMQLALLKKSESEDIERIRREYSG